jgi:hypothetical protein
MRDIIIQGLSIAVVSSFFIGVGLRILLAKRPVIEGSGGRRSHSLCH